MDFIKRHAQTLYACDFVTKRVLTWTGWHDAYFLVFIHIGSRRVWVHVEISSDTNSSRQPNRAQKQSTCAIGSEPIPLYARNPVTPILDVERQDYRGDPHLPVIDIDARLRLHRAA